ncbi:MAG TPA: circadian clock protein KaiB [Methanosarcina sp.]|nr:circadian clock protein KaiB [Methanosarcina sp.]
MEDAEQPGCSANDGRYEENIYELKLYVICDNQKSQIAFANLKDICDKYLEGKCHIEIIDLKKSPDLARLDQIVAVPTLIRKNYPGKKIVGDLSDQKKVMEVLDLRTPSFTGASNEKGSV